MNTPDSDKIFAGSIPQLYETYRVPLISEPCAEDLAHRLSSISLARVLEIAAGTVAMDGKHQAHVVAAER